jgi:SAM-dependent methyltransferase
MTQQFSNTEAANRSGEHVSFSFGANWRKFLENVDERQLVQAEASVSESFGDAEFSGKRFVDVGSGSGIFSLAALRLGAAEIHSIDFDPNSVGCTAELKRRYGDERWTVERGSILDKAFVARVEPADLLYSWGVLHHTGGLWEALENALRLLKPGGLACIALYVEPSHVSVHMALKRTYNRLPRALRPALSALYAGAWLGKATLSGRSPVAHVRNYGKASRGMRFWRDVEDWLGGLPCEFADEREMRAFVEPRGFEVVEVKVGKPGANGEYLLRRA